MPMPDSAPIYAMRKIFIPSFLIVVATLQTTAQKPTPTPDVTRLGELKLTSSLKDELSRSEIEPRSKRFKMSAHFLRAQYNRQVAANPVGHQYIWGTYTEGFLMLQFFEYPAGTLPKSPDALKQNAIKRYNVGMGKASSKTLSEKDVKIGDALGKQFEIIVQGRKAIVRTFAYDDVWYALTAIPVPYDAGPTIEKFFDSFQFVK